MRGIVVARARGGSLGVVVAPAVLRLAPVVARGLDGNGLGLRCESLVGKRRRVRGLARLGAGRRGRHLRGGLNRLGLRMRGIVVARARGGDLGVVVAPAVLRLAPVVAGCGEINMWCYLIAAVIRGVEIVAAIAEVLQVDIVVEFVIRIGGGFHTSSQGDVTALVEIGRRADGDSRRGIHRAAVYGYRRCLPIYATADCRRIALRFRPRDHGAAIYGDSVSICGIIVIAGFSVVSAGADSRRIFRAVRIHVAIVYGYGPAGPQEAAAYSRVVRAKVICTGVGRYAPAIYGDCAALFRRDGRDEPAIYILRITSAVAANRRIWMVAGHGPGVERTHIVAQALRIHGEAIGVGNMDAIFGVECHAIAQDEVHVAAHLDTVGEGHVAFHHVPAIRPCRGVGRDDA